MLLFLPWEISFKLANPQQLSLLLLHYPMFLEQHEYTRKCDEELKLKGGVKSTQTHAGCCAVRCVQFLCTLIKVSVESGGVLNGTQEVAFSM